MNTHEAKYAMPLSPNGRPTSNNASQEAKHYPQEARVLKVRCRRLNLRHVERKSDAY